MSETIKIFGETHIGRKRKNNEDDFGTVDFGYPSACAFCVVADGMGGHRHGNIASKVAVNYVLDTVISKKDQFSRTTILEPLIKGANDVIYNMSVENEELRGMGTTLVISCFAKDKVSIANVGDSRVYIIRNRTINSLTVDNSIVGELISNGTITNTEAREHPQRNVITRAVGTVPSIEVDVYEYDCKQGDIFLVCTDGLTSMLTDDEILKIVLMCDYSDIANKLIQSANDNGGFDNITVVAIIHE